MDAETGLDIGSIASDTDAVKNYHGVADKIRRIERLWMKRRMVDCRVKFEIGDTLLSVDRDSSTRMRRALVKKFGKDLSTQFRQFAWVAKRWKDEAARVVAIEQGKPWSYFRDNVPGGDPAPKKSYKVQTFDEKRTTVNEDGDWIFQGVSPGLLEGRVIVPRQRMEMILRGQGWEPHN